MSQKQIYLGIGGVVLLAALIAGYLRFGPAAVSPTPAVAAAAAGVTLTADERTLGSANAPVTVVEYAAPSCPVCARFDADVFPHLKQTYIDTGKVYYVFRMYPISTADGAAEAIARCLPKDQYFPFIEVLFRRQSEWDPEFDVADVHGALVKMARVTGMSAEQVDRCIADKAVQQRINQVAKDAQTRYGLDATPTLIIDGAPQTPGAMPWSDLQATVEAALKKKH